MEEKAKLELSDNKYFKWYWSICDRAKDRILESSIYIEEHHIYPKSIYGKNKFLVNLTAKEHYIAHLVLWWGLRSKYGTRDEKTRKMAYAFSCMNIKSNTHGFRYDAIEYSFSKIANSEKMKNRVVSKETRKKMSIAASGENNYFYGKHFPRGEHLSVYHYDKHVIEKMIEKNSKEVGQWNKDGIFIKKYKSIISASIETGIAAGSISACCANRLITAGGYIWSFVDDKLIIDKKSVLANKKKYNTQYIIETPNHDIIKIIGRENVIDFIGGSYKFFRVKRYKKYKLLDKVKINK